MSKSDVESILAEHGRWVAKLRDGSRLLEQRMVMLERRISALEGHIAELTKMYCKIDAQTSCVGDQITRLASKIDFLNARVVKKSRKNPGV